MGLSRQIIALGLLTVLAGCGQRYLSPGEWQGERDLKTPPGTEPYVATTLKRVRLTIHDSGKFDLSDGGVPYGGSVDFALRDQKLNVDLVLGQRVGGGGGATAPPDYSIKIKPDHSILLEGGVQQTPVLLAPTSKP
jgi:hypothetical protein